MDYNIAVILVPLLIIFFLLSWTGIQIGHCKKDNLMEELINTLL